MLASAARPFVWGVQGGAAPSSFEVLTVDAEGAARLVIANAWPGHPPFDEVGSYAWRPRASDLDDLPGCVLPGDSLPAPTRDSGVAYLEFWVGGAGAWEAEWNALARPPALEGCLQQVERLVAAGRRHPRSALRASLRAASADEMWLDLASVGTEAFRTGTVDGAGTRLRIRAAVVSPQDAARPDRLPPALVACAASEHTLPEVVAPGEAESVLVAVPGGGGGGAVAVLVEVTLPLVSLSGEAYLQPAWLLPAPFVPGDAQKQKGAGYGAPASQEKEFRDSNPTATLP